MPLPTLLGLIICNAIWAHNPLMGKILMRHFSPLQAAWLRFAGAWISFVLLLGVSYVRSGETRRQWRLAWSRSALSLLASIGIVTFCWSPISQYLGLAKSSSTANALLVATEPLFAILFAWLFLGERLSRREAAAFFVAFLGFLLLSEIRPFDFWDSLALFNVGNLWILSSIPGEALYSILSRKLVFTLSPLLIFGIALSCGFLFLSLWLFGVVHEPFPGLGQFSLGDVGALVWLGPVGTTAAYMYWSSALKKAPVAFVVLTLFLQPILGAISGNLLLRERLSLWQDLGGFFILLALAIQSLPYAFRKENK